MPALNRACNKHSETFDTQVTQQDKKKKRRQHNNPASASRNGRDGTRQRLTDKNAIAHKSAHLATGLDREPLAQHEFQLVLVLVLFFRLTPPTVACQSLLLFVTVTVTVI